MDKVIQNLEENYKRKIKENICTTHLFKVLVIFFWPNLSLSHEIYLFLGNFTSYIHISLFFPVFSFIQFVSKIYSFTKKIFLIHSKKIFIQEISTLLIQRNYSFNWKIDYCPWLDDGDNDGDDGDGDDGDGDNDWVEAEVVLPPFIGRVSA